MIVSKNDDVAAVAVEGIEGQSVYGGELNVKPLMMGEEMMFMELHYAAGVGAPPHVHDHESVTYVVRGRVKMRVGDDVHILGPGDVCRHPKGVPHGVEALEESVMIEVKSPAPDMSRFFKFGQN